MVTGDNCNTIDKTMYIVVLAGGMKTNSTEIHDFVKKRLDKAILLYNEYKKNNACPKIICQGGGTYHKVPTLDDKGFVVHEATACALYLSNYGIPEKDIYKEWGSYDTIANGYFFFVNFALPLNISGTIDIITSEFHMKRVITIYEHFNKLFSRGIRFNCHLTENHNMTLKTIETRNDRERESTKIFIENSKTKFTSIKRFSEWLYTEHNAYKAFAEYKVNDDINDTY